MGPWPCDSEINEYNQAKTLPCAVKGLIYFQHLHCWQDLRMTFCKERIPCKNEFRAVTNRFCLSYLQVNLHMADTRTSCCMYSEASVSMY